MKRILLISALLLASVSIFAARPLKVTKGSLDVFKQDVTATWTIDLYGTLLVVDAVTGEVSVEVKLTNVKGEEDFEETPRFPSAMTSLCRDLFKLKK